MTHPCTTHLDQCDHCYRCDVLGECCLTPAVVQAGHPTASFVQPDRLHDAVVEDAKAALSLGELVRLDSGPPGLAVLLLPGSASAPIPNDSRKEAERVSVPRNHR
ncbi:MAG TPA: hypothetical protein VG125_08365 [Pirellulales bacterium]|jgi:hypothetical protein|nr:hypothetical protein [Pirellulales bacterium]